MYKINRRGCIKDDNMEVVIVVIKLRGMLRVRDSYKCRWIKRYYVGDRWGIRN